LYFHPKTLLNLFTAYLPLTVGLSVLPFMPIRSDARVSQNSVRRLQMIVAFSVVLVAVLFFTFIVGAGHFGRYLLPTFPFLFIGGAAGLTALHQRLRNRNPLIAGLIVLGIVAFFIVVNGADWKRRIGRNEQYVSNLSIVLRAPRARSQTTAELLARVGANGPGPFHFAVTEVQLRYYVDKRIVVHSLDGRTSAHILDFTDRRTGLPDFGRYFEMIKPDYVELGQWCQWGGFGLFARLRGDIQMSPNLICDWTTRSAGMKPGDSFDWLGRTVYMTQAGYLGIRGWSTNP